MLVKTNIQVYFHDSDDSFSKISSDVKKRMFLRGMLAEINIIGSFEQFIIQNGLFDIISIDGDTYTKSDGTTGTALFLPIVERSTPQDVDIFCAFFALNVEPSRHIHYLARIKMTEIPNGVDTNIKLDKDIITHINTLIRLYNTVAETIIDSIGDEEITAVDILEKLINRN